MINVHSRPSSPVLSASSPPSLVADSVVEETNTLILTGLNASFFEPDVLNTLRGHFESYGKLYAWAPLKGFGRIIMVYYSAHDGEQARVECHRMWLTNEEGKTLAQLKLYRGTPTVIEEDTVTLPIPEATNRFLVSPPGSPPVGWEPIEEEAPNTQALASDLVAALQRLQVQQNAGPQPPGVQVLMVPEEVDDEDVDMEGTHTPPAQGAAGTASTHTSPSPRRTKGLSVILQDCDYVEPPKTGTLTPDEGEGVWQGEMMRGGINRVKATVASMGISTPAFSATGMLGSSLSASAPARVPTPRPPAQSP